MVITAWNIGVVVIGYAISLFGGHFIVNRIIVRLWRHHLPDREQHVALVAAVGILDRFLFTTAYLIGVQEFIAVWLVIKFAGQWTPSRTDVDRPLYLIFLIGNGLSLIIAVGAAMLMQSLIRP